MSLTKRRSDKRRSGARLLGAALIPFALILGGCSADDVEFNGKIFDAVGLNNKSSRTEPKLRERAGLVMPPDIARVPEPGVPPEARNNEVAALQDPDATAKTSRAELERQQAAYCKVNYEQAKARGDDNADLAAGPLGLCRGSVLTAIQNWNKDEDGED